ncbi:MAG TPA: hypothetical protein ENI77_12620 [Nitrospirae bacterium]|nr:hypothetical protein [Nitrospirota bacterium]
MKVKCPSCSKIINVPDEKIPARGVFNFNCPNCKNPVSASIDEKAISEIALPDLGDLPETTPTPQPLDETQDIPVPPRVGGDIPALPDFEDAMENELDILQEGKFRALVADNENLDRVSPVLKKMDYVITSVKSHDEAIQKLTFNKYDIIALSETFAGCDPAENAIHKYLEPLTMDIRRKMFIVMTGKKFKTMDNMQAFNKSANLVLNESDFGNFELILKKSIKDSELFYHIFNTMLIETGKEIAR